MRWWAVLALSGCAKAPLEMHLDGLPSPWLTLERDGRIVGYTGEEAAKLDLASSELFDVGSGETFAEEAVRFEAENRCSLSDDRTFRCAHQAGRVERWRGTWGVREHSVLSTLWSWNPPQPLEVSAGLRRDGLTVAEGSAAVYRDGTIRETLCRFPLLSTCASMPEVIGTWDRDTVTMADGRMFRVELRICSAQRCAERVPSNLNVSGVGLALQPPPDHADRPYLRITTWSERDPVMEDVGFTLAAHLLLEALDGPP